MLEIMLEPGLVPEEIALGEIRRMHVDEYMQLAESGAYEDEKVELLEGVVVEMSPQGIDHRHLITLLTRLLGRRLPDELMVTPQCTYKIPPYSAPEPDFTINTASSVWQKKIAAVWIIEVAVTSQRRDRGLKAKIYAKAGIVEYWVVDAKAMVVYIHLDPSPDGYRSVIRYDATDQIAPRAIPALAFSLDDLVNDRVKLDR